MRNSKFINRLAVVLGISISLILFFCVAFLTQSQTGVKVPFYFRLSGFLFCVLLNLSDWIKDIKEVL